MKATFYNTVDILVKAYLNDTLEHQNCAACAVGNIIAAANGSIMLKIPPYGCSKLTVITKPEIESWFSFSQRVLETPQTLNTGYEWYELATIERAFESVYGMEASDITFEGLMKVVEVLSEIHGVSLEQKEQAKRLFKPELV
jgi:hypothetical protein